MIDLTVYEIQAKLLLEEMQKQATALGEISRYSYSKTVGIAVKLKPDEVMERLYKMFHGARIISPRANFIVVITDVHFITISVVHRAKYCSVGIAAWTSSQQSFLKLEAEFQSLFRDSLAQGPICGMRWAFSSSNGQDSIFLEELIEETVHAEAYPALIQKWGSVDNFIDKYYESDSAILILQGKPGTGKSRLIRYLLSKFVTKVDRSFTDDHDEARSTYKSSVLYTSDEKLFESDELFARFITNEEKIFIVEDADHILQPRTNGNKNVHRFLTISDGIFRAVGKKVIFTSNLANIGDIDDALRRPGRCFAHESFNYLTPEQSMALAAKLGKKVDVTSNSKLTVADIYTS